MGAPGVTYSDVICSSVADAALAVGLIIPDDFSYRRVLLLQGAIASAVEFDPTSGARRKKMGKFPVMIHALHALPCTLTSDTGRAFLAPTRLTTRTGRCSAIRA